MSDHERTLTVASLTVVSIFYLVAIFFFLISDRTRLNYALATQKAIWLAIIIGIALPGYSRSIEMALPSEWRVLLWASLSVITLWVLVEVYRENRGKIKARVVQMIRRDRIPTWPEVERRNGQDRRRQVAE